MKTIFAVLGASDSNKVAAAVRKHFPADSLEIDRGQWLLSAEGTSLSVCEQLGVISIGDSGVITKGPTGSALVVAVSGYYGIQAANVWEWMKAHWETK